MAVTTPLMGINFAHGTFPLRDVITANTFNVGTGSISGGGYLADNTGEYGYINLIGSQQPPAWNCTIHIRCAHGLGGYHSLAGIKKGTGGISVMGLQMLNSGVFRGIQNTTSGLSTQITNFAGIGSVVRGANATDFSLVTDYFIRFKSASNSTQGKINSGAVVTDSASALSTTAPIYGGAAFIIGTDPGDVGNPIMKAFQVGFWNVNLGDAEIAEIITDPVAAYLSVYNNPLKRRSFVSQATPVSLIEKISPIVFMPGPPKAGVLVSPPSSGGSTKNSWFRRRKFR